MLDHMHSSTLSQIVLHKVPHTQKQKQAPCEIHTTYPLPTLSSNVNLPVLEHPST